MLGGHAADLQGASCAAELKTLKTHVAPPDHKLAEKLKQEKAFVEQKKAQHNRTIESLRGMIEAAEKNLQEECAEH